MYLTNTVFELVIEDLVNGWGAVVDVSPVTGRHVLGVFLAEAEIVVFIVICRLRSTSSRESHCTQVRGVSTRGNSL